MGPPIDYDAHVAPPMKTSRVCALVLPDMNRTHIALDAIFPEASYSGFLPIS